MSDVPPNRNPYLGFKYEDTILSHLAIRCTLHNKVKKFWIQSNAPGYESLDDIALDVEYDNGKKELFLFQLKHKAVDTKSNIKFTYDKYMNDYTTVLNNNPNMNITVILYTNADITKLPDYKKFSETSFDKNDIFKAFKTSENGKIFQFTVNNQNNESEKVFKNNTWVFTNQSSAQETESLISRDLDNAVSYKEINNILKHFENANLKRNDRLSKQEITWMLAENILHPYVNIIYKRDEEIENEELLIDTLNKFNISVISEKSVNIIQHCIVASVIKYFKINDFTNNMWLKDVPLQILTENMNNILQCKHTSGKVIYIDLIYSLWANKKIPIIVSYQEEHNSQIIFALKNFCQEFSIIIINKNNTFVPPKNLTVFENMSNIIDQQSIQKNLENMKLTLQQKEEISLNNLIEPKHQVLYQIVPDIYIKLLSKQNQISKRSNTNEIYISRNIKVRLFKKTILENTSVLFIVDDNNKYMHIRDYESDKRNNNIFYTDLPLNETKELLEKYKLNKPYCCLRKFRDYYIYYAYSQSIDQLLCHLHLGTINECRLISFGLPFYIIYGNAGMGKTTLLANMETTIPKDHWSVNINLLEQSNKLNQKEILSSREEFIKYIINLQFINEDTSFKCFLRKLFDHQLKKQKVFIFVDGFDEVDLDCQVILKIYNLLRVPIFVTTRPSKRAMLEKLLQTHAVELFEFSKDDQKRYIMKNDTSGNNEKTIERIVERLNANNNLCFLGIPLLTKLLVDVLINLDQDMKCDKINILYLYEKYLNKHMEKYDRRDKRFIKKLAFKMLFTKYIENTSKEDNFEDDLEDFKNNHYKDNILGGFNSESVPIFVHRTFAEYLCAIYLKENRQECAVNYEKLYTDETLLQARYFFDLAVCKELPLHAAVLNNDDKKFKNILTEANLRNTDEFKRNILHLAISYGKRHHDLHMDLAKLAVGVSTDQFQINKDIINTVIEATNSDKLIYSTDVFNNNPLSYVFWTRSFDTLDTLCRVKPETNLPDYFLSATFVYCVVHFNYYSIFNVIVKDSRFRKIIANKDFLKMVANEIKYKENSVIMKAYIGNHENVTILHIAAEKGSLEIAISIVQNGIFLKNVTDFYNNTPLHFAAKNGKVNLVEWLLERNLDTLTTNQQEQIVGFVDINGKTKTGITPLILAVKKKQIHTANLLVNKGADVTVKAFDNQNVLHFLGKDSIEVALAKKIIASSNSIINQKDLYGKTPLFLAVEYNNIDMVKLLIDNNAHLNVKTNTGQNILHAVACGGNVELAKDIIEGYYLLINEKDEREQSPLHLSIEHKNTDMTKFLIEKGADVTIKFYHNNSILHRFVLWRNVELVDKLIESNSFLINQQDLIQYTPLCLAVELNLMDMFDLLIKKGADVNLKDKQGNNLLHIAARAEDIRFTHKIFRINSDLINEKNNNGESPLFAAVRENRVDVITFLIDNGADLNLKNSSGDNLLHIAAKSGVADLAAKLIKSASHFVNERNNVGETPLYLSAKSQTVSILLINNGAELDITDIYGDTMLHAAARGGNLDLARRLIEKKTALINQKGKDGLTPLFYAVLENRVEMIKYLFVNGADADIKTDVGDNVMHYVGKFGNISTAEAMLPQCKSLINERNHEGKTPLDSVYNCHWRSHQQKLITLFEETIGVQAEKFSRIGEYWTDSVTQPS